jgi:hypothetical protein
MAEADEAVTAIRAIAESTTTSPMILWYFMMILSVRLLISWPKSYHEKLSKQGKSV